MMQRTGRLALVALISLGLCGCAATDDSNPTAVLDGGSFELALSEICAVAPDTQCIPVGAEQVARSSDFEQAAVENVAMSSDNQPNSIDVTLTDGGAKILNDLTTQASRGGDGSRLLVKVGDEIIAAVSVREPLTGDRVTLGLSPEYNADAIIERIQGGE